MTAPRSVLAEDYSTDWQAVASAVLRDVCQIARWLRAESEWLLEETLAECDAEVGLLKWLHAEKEYELSQANLREVELSIGKALAKRQGAQWRAAAEEYLQETAEDYRQGVKGLEADNASLVDDLRYAEAFIDNQELRIHELESLLSSAENKADEWKEEAARQYRIRMDLESQVSPPSSGFVDYQHQSARQFLGYI